MKQRSSTSNRIERAARVLSQSGLFVVALGASGCGANDDSLPGDDELGTEQQAGGIFIPPIPNCTLPQTRHWNPTGGFWYCAAGPAPQATNLAVNKPAVQSSTLTGSSADASRANDNNTNGNYFAGSVSHTNNGFIAPGQGQYWRVDLSHDTGAQRMVTQIVIRNRTDCCTERLSHYKVYGWNAGVWQVINDQSSSNTAGQGTITLGVNVNTRFIMIQKTDDNYLHLAEVQVMGF